MYAVRWSIGAATHKLMLHPRICKKDGTRLHVIKIYHTGCVCDFVTLHKIQFDHRFVCARIVVNWVSAVFRCIKKEPASYLTVFMYMDVSSRPFLYLLRPEAREMEVVLICCVPLSAQDFYG
jgi:hypothetical protein